MKCCVLAPTRRCTGCSGGAPGTGEVVAVKRAKPDAVLCALSPLQCTGGVLPEGAPGAGEVVAVERAQAQCSLCCFSPAGVPGGVAGGDPGAGEVVAVKRPSPCVCVLFSPAGVPGGVAGGAPGAGEVVAVKRAKPDAVLCALSPLQVYRGGVARRGPGQAGEDEWPLKRAKPNTVLCALSPPAGVPGGVAGGDPGRRVSGGREAGQAQYSLCCYFFPAGVPGGVARGGPARRGSGGREAGQAPGAPRLELICGMELELLASPAAPQPGLGSEASAACRGSSSWCTSLWRRGRSSTGSGTRVSPARPLRLSHLPGLGFRVFVFFYWDVQVR